MYFSDINECTNGAHSCKDESQQCVNTRGSYYCRCADGYSATALKKICEGLFQKCNSQA